MKPWDQFLPDILPHCPGCPDLVAEEEARNAAEEFLTETKAWRQWIGGMVTVAGQTDYTPYLPAGARLVKLHEATLDGEPLDVEGIRAAERGGAYKATTDLIAIILGPDAPVAGKTLRVRLSLSLKSTATGLDDVMFDAYRMAIADGAIARICRAEGKPYSNPSKADAHEVRFQQAISTARARAARGHSSDPKRVVSQFF